MVGLSEYRSLLARLGWFKTGKSCLYVKRLQDVDLEILMELVKRSAKHLASPSC